MSRLAMDIHNIKEIKVQHNKLKVSGEYVRNIEISIYNDEGVEMNLSLFSKDLGLSLEAVQ